MKEQRKTAVLVDDWDWPAEEPGYGMRSLDDPSAAAPPQAPATSAPAPRLVAPAPASPLAIEERPLPPRPIPCAARPDHFPAMFARSGLFSAQRQCRAVAAPSQKIAIKGQMRHSLEFEGPRLSMNDKAIYEAVVVLAKSRKHDLNAPLLASLSAIADEMGWANRGGRSLAWIWAAVERLAACEVSLELANGKRATGKLLEQATKSHAGIELTFDPAYVLAAFGDGQQFKIDRARRCKLGSPLAQWLHDFLSTHKEGHPLTLSYLQELCGSGASSKRFCHALRASATSLCQAAPELAKSFAMDESRRSSESWSIKFERGSEACDFFAASDFKQQRERAEKSARQRGLKL